MDAGVVHDTSSSCVYYMNICIPEIKNKHMGDETEERSSPFYIVICVHIRGHKIEMENIITDKLFERDYFLKLKLNNNLVSPKYDVPRLQ